MRQVGGRGEEGERGGGGGGRARRRAGSEGQGLVLSGALLVCHHADQ